MCIVWNRYIRARQIALHETIFAKQSCYIRIFKVFDVESGAALGPGAETDLESWAAGLARTLVVPRAVFDAPEYRSYLKVRAEIAGLAGEPGFTVRLKDAEEEADTYEGLRAAVMATVAKGVSLQRFKGLGEMNAEQLRATTMDPATRTLAQVTMEDAAAADQIFSMLMGDQVEPRREFIEGNGHLVANLDV